MAHMMTPLVAVKESVVRGFVLGVNRGGLTLPEEVGAFPGETWVKR